MCIIINTNNHRFTDIEFFKSCARTNPDGWGITSYGVNKNGNKVVHMSKGMLFNDFWDNYKSLLDRGHTDLNIHFRMCTHGSISQTQCHPFNVGTSYPIYMMHNGVTPYPGPQTALHGEESDTCLFAKRFVKPLLAAVAHPNEFIRTEKFERLILSMGRGKFTFTDQFGHVILKKLSHFDELPSGLLVSNVYSFPTKYAYKESFYPYSEEFDNSSWN